MKQKSVCVYCGSRPGNDPEYMAQAHAVGQGLARENWRLVYGAGDVGLMGAVARAAQLAGGNTFGVIPEHLVKWEVGKTDLTRYIVTETMHERKKVMFMNCDAVVVLPGGAGSLDELFEVLTWRQLGLHSKPIILVNTNTGIRCLRFSPMSSPKDSLMKRCLAISRQSPMQMPPWNCCTNF